MGDINPQMNNTSPKSNSKKALLVVFIAFMILILILFYLIKMYPFSTEPQTLEVVKNQNVADSTNHNYVVGNVYDDGAEKYIFKETRLLSNGDSVDVFLKQGANPNDESLILVPNTLIIKSDLSRFIDETESGLTPEAEVFFKEIGLSVVSFNYTSRTLGEMFLVSVNSDQTIFDLRRLVHDKFFIDNSYGSVLINFYENIL